MKYIEIDFKNLDKSMRDNNVVTINLIGNTLCLLDKNNNLFAIEKMWHGGYLDNFMEKGYKIKFFKVDNKHSPCEVIYTYNESSVLEVLEDYGFGYSSLYNQYEVQTWTDMGVNIVFYIDKDNLIQDIIDFCNSFNPELEVLNYVEDESYMTNIGLRDGIKDFDNFKLLLNRVERDVKQLRA